MVQAAGPQEPVFEPAVVPTEEGNVLADIEAANADVAPAPFTSGSAYQAWLAAGAVPGTEAEFE